MAVRAAARAAASALTASGTVSTGEHYKYGTFATADDGVTSLSFEGGSAAVNEGNLVCWSKGYHRLRKILQEIPVPQ